MSRNRSIIAVIAVILLVGGSVLAVSMTGANNVAKHLEFGNGHLQEGNYEEAIRAFEKAIRIDPENIGARMALAEAFIMTGDTGKAEMCLKEVLELEPGMAEAGIRLAGVYDEKGETAKAISLLEEILKAEAENIDNNVYIKLADLKIKARDLDGAILLLEEAYQ
ncbi:MAG TPA: tetratricopeptide repeat protein, partial [Clostridia bacterium]